MIESYLMMYFFCHLLRFIEFIYILNRINFPFSKYSLISFHFKFYNLIYSSIIIILLSKFYYSINYIHYQLIILLPLLMNSPNLNYIIKMLMLQLPSFSILIYLSHFEGTSNLSNKHSLSSYFPYINNHFTSYQSNHHFYQKIISFSPQNRLPKLSW